MTAIAATIGSQGRTARRAVTRGPYEAFISWIVLPPSTTTTVPVT